MSWTTRVRGRIIGAVAALAIAPVLAVAMAPSANAWTYTNAGRPGGMQVPQTVGLQSGGTNHLVLPYRYVWRSSATTGTQTVVVSYDLWGKSVTNSLSPWAKQRHTVSASIAAGAAGVYVNGWDFSPDPFTKYSADVLVTWYSSAGAQLGQQYVDYNGLSDYRCAVATCTVSSDSAVGAAIGVYGMF